MSFRVKWVIIGRAYNCISNLIFPVYLTPRKVRASMPAASGDDLVDALMSIDPDEVLHQAAAAKPEASISARASLPTKTLQSAPHQSAFTLSSSTSTQSKESALSSLKPAGLDEHQMVSSTVSSFLPISNKAPLAPSSEEVEVPSASSFHISSKIESCEWACTVCTFLNPPLVSLSINRASIKPVNSRLLTIVLDH